MYIFQNRNVFDAWRSNRMVMSTCDLIQRDEDWGLLYVMCTDTLAIYHNRYMLWSVNIVTVKYA